jgi:hypothetical protein
MAHWKSVHITLGGGRRFNPRQMHYLKLGYLHLKMKMRAFKISGALEK